MLTPTITRNGRFSSSTRIRQDNRSMSASRYGRANFAHPGSDLVEMARKNQVSRQHGADVCIRRQRWFVFVIMALTIFFPLVGILALCGVFDSSLSWFTEGELHQFSQRQRLIMKAQVYAELVLYPALIVTLGVYFSLRY